MIFAWLILGLSGMGALAAYVYVEIHLLRLTEGK